MWLEDCWKRNKMVFKKGMISHNKGKTKDNYEPLKRQGEKLIGRKFSDKHKNILSKSKKRLFKQGKLIIWNKGLTKETDERVRKNVENAKKTKNSEEWKETIGKEARKKSSETQKRKYNTGGIRIWNSGLTKETDERVRKNSINTSDARKKLFKIGKLVMHNKDKTYEEIYGMEKANELKEKKSISMLGPNNFRYGKEVTKETREKQSIAKLGSKNSSWLGGISFEPYTKEFNKEFKASIRKRDSYRCMKCGKQEYEELQKIGRRLAIHHIDYNKEISIPQNCCSLCMFCNIEVNYNRKQWTKFFQSLLYERYGYKYSESNEIILEVG